ncbi:MAG: hypothetical protein AB7G06_01365 [Bdellovibrionales bacterium]
MKTIFTQAQVEAAWQVLQNQLLNHGGMCSVPTTQAVSNKPPFLDDAEMEKLRKSFMLLMRDVDQLDLEMQLCGYNDPNTFPITQRAEHAPGIEFVTLDRPSLKPNPVLTTIFDHAGLEHLLKRSVPYINLTLYSNGLILKHPADQPTERVCYNGDTCSAKWEPSCPDFLDLSGGNTSCIEECMATRFIMMKKGQKYYRKNSGMPGGKEMVTYNQPDGYLRVSTFQPNYKDLSTIDMRAPVLDVSDFLVVPKTTDSVHEEFEQMLKHAEEGTRDDVQTRYEIRSTGTYIQDYTFLERTLGFTLATKGGNCYYAPTRVVHFTGDHVYGEGKALAHVKAGMVGYYRNTYPHYVTQSDFNEQLASGALSLVPLSDPSVPYKPRTDAKATPR